MTAKNDSEIVRQVFTIMKKAKASDSTAIRVSNLIYKYIEFRKLSGEEHTPDTLMIEARTDFTKCKEQIENYYAYLKGEKVEGYPTIKKPILESSARQDVYSKIVSFYSHQDIRFPKGFTPTISKEAKANRSDKDHEFVVLNEDQTATVIDKTELKAVLNAMTPRDRAIGLCMLSSSQDSGDVLALNVGDFKNGCKMNGTGVRFFFTNERAKTDVRFQTFFSVEAVEAVSNYLKTERRQALDSEPLFTNNNGKRVSASNLSENFRYASTSIGITWGDDQHNPFRPKRLRNYFTTCADKARVDKFIIKQFTGHTLTQTEEYIQNRADLEIQYKKIEPYLTIFQGGEQLERTVQVLVETESTIKELKEIISDIRFQRDSIKDKLEKEREQFNIEMKNFTKLWTDQMKDAGDLIQKYSSLYAISEQKVADLQEEKEREERT